MDPVLLDLLQDDAENERISAVANVLVNVVGVAQNLLSLIDEPLREHIREELPPLNVDFWRHLGDPTFKNDFRMSRVLFEELFTALSPHMDWGRDVKIDRRVQLMMGLWIMATPDSFRSVGRKFGVQRATVHFVYLKVLGALNTVAADYIRWPNLGEMELISNRFLEKGPFPGIVGVVDGCNVEIRKPHENPVAFYDRKGRYSIKLQAICDDTLQFRDVYIGECGSLNDTTVFSRSPVSRVLRDEHAFPNNCHIVGDAAYVLRNRCIVPYKRFNRNELTEVQRNFNYILSKSRVTIENAFARLQTKWRRILVDFDVSRLDYAVKHIMACCVLHNFIIRGGESFPEPDEPQVAARLNRDPDEPSDGSGDEDDMEIPGNARGEAAALRQQAQEKRNQIAAALPMLPRVPVRQAARRRQIRRRNEE